MNKYKQMNNQIADYIKVSWLLSKSENEFCFSLMNVTYFKNHHILSYE